MGDHYIKRFKGDFIPLDLKGLLKEVKVFIQNTKLKNTIFRTDHISNYLVLKGTLSRDKQKILSEIDETLEKAANMPFDYSRNIM